MIKSLHLLVLVLALAGHRVSGQHPAQRYTSDQSDGLVAFYPFNGNANDESGNKNNPTYIGSGVTLAPDRFGIDDRAYYFDGNEGSYIKVPADSYPTTDRTVSMWVNVTDLPAYQGRTPFSYGGNACNTTSFLTGINNAGNSSFWSAGHCNQSSILYTYSVSPINTWKHWVITIEGSVQKLYIDGELKTTASYAGATYVAGKSAIIGALVYTDGNTVYVDASVGYFKGKIDDIRIYNNALTEIQVQDLYKSESSNLVAYYPFNGNANDESGNGNHGTIIGTLTPTADRYGTEGKAYKFWHPDYISVPTNSSFFSDQFTVSYWYKVASYWGERGVLSCVGKNGGYQQYFTGTNFAYLIGYNFPRENSYFSSNFTVSDQPGIWHHNTVTYQKTGENLSISKFYINGELKKTDNQPVVIAYPGEEKFNLGKNVDVNFNGELDDIRIYSRALTGQEIKDLFITGTKPVLQYPANLSSVTTLTPEMLWSSPLANVEFRFQLSTDSLFGSILHELVTNNPSTQLPAALLIEGQNYYWRVQTTLNGETGPWSELWSFNFINTGLDKQTGNTVALRIYPSPANASVKISFLLPETTTNGAPVTLEMVNSIGTCIKKMTVKNALHGFNEAEVETASLPSGIYYCRLKAGDISLIRKLVIIH